MHGAPFWDHKNAFISAIALAIPESYKITVLTYTQFSEKTQLLIILYHRRFKEQLNSNSIREILRATTKKLELKILNCSNIF